MIRMFVRHSVNDFAKWKTAYDAFDTERKAAGVQGDGVFKLVGDPNDITAWHDFESMEVARSFAGSDRLRQVMADAGVAGEPTIWFTTKV